MNIVEKLKNKTIGYWIGCVAALLTLAGIIVFGAYQGRGGAGSGAVYAFGIIGIALWIALFFYDGFLSDLISIAAAVLYTLALGYSLVGGVGNITDAVSNIVLFGIAELAPMNYAMAALFGIGAVLTVVACFLRKSKENKD